MPVQPQPVPTFNPDALHIKKSSQGFYDIRIDDGESENAVSDPAIVASDVASQITFMRKLKFQYIEQNAKDKYTKYIVNDLDDAPLISAEDNKVLTESNQVKKRDLQEKKAILREKCDVIRNLAPLVEEDLNKAQRNIAELTDLSSKTLDARLALTRIRTTHPLPRLTISSAHQKLDEQTGEMQTLSDQVEDLNRRIQIAKDRLKAANRLTEVLRAEKQKTDDNAQMNKLDADAGIVPLYDWFTESIALHKAVSSLASCKPVSDNELLLIYVIPPADSPAPHPRREISISLIFVPDTQQLAKVVVGGMDDVDLGDVVDVHVNSNDVRGLIAAILKRAR